MCSIGSNFPEKKVVIDDEAYFKLSNFELAGNSGYYSSNPALTNNDVKLKRSAKFEEKLLVWVAISPDGCSRPYIAPSGQAVDQDVYVNKCLSDRLIPFINQVHKKDDVVFWPDLASSHYSNKATEFLRSNNIEFVPRSSNPASAPELRPIEDFWTELGREVYKGGWQAENLDQLRDRIRYAFNKIDLNRVHYLGSRTFTRVDKVRRKGFARI